jgi:hypothetical protein
MNSRIKSTSKPLPGVKTKSKGQRTIAKAKVGKSIGAKRVEAVKDEVAGSPPSLFGVRQELYQRLRSTGGRRSLEGAVRRQKIPLLEGDWERLEKVATLSASEGIQPTPAQVASILLHKALNELK